jgi:hypothetical protein
MTENERDLLYLKNWINHLGGIGIFLSPITLPA